MNAHMSTNVHVYPHTGIEVVHQVGEGYQSPVIKLGDYPALANIFFDSPDGARRLRDALDAYLVGRLGGEA
jgi:hypothetical protein